MPTYTPLQSIQLTEATSSVVFSGIPQIYQDLVIVANAGNNGGTGYGLSVQFNGDTASNYSFTHAYGTGSSAVSARSSNTTFILGGFTPSSIGGSTCVINVLNYSNTTTNKTVLSRGSEADYRVSAIVGLWRSTSAVTSIRLLDEGANNFLAGSTFDLYGISPVAANNAQAAGGTDIYYDSTYVYHVFKGSGTFTPYRNLTADVLVVAGGGSGGGVAGGGGGAGGVRSTVTWTGGNSSLGTNLESSISLIANTSYTVTIGAGGPGVSAGNVRGNSGSSSVFSTITSTGGGGGGSNNLARGSDGGSGGGSRAGTGSGGTGTSGQGFDGGIGVNLDSSGAGGGASAVGGNSNDSTNSAGAGGAGLYTALTNAVQIGQLSGGNYYVGGGGGGAVTNGSGGGAGGLGGGGAGKNGGASGDGISGTTNTGGGGGGTRQGANTGVFGGNGGSGIVIVRYAR